MQQRMKLHQHRRGPDGHGRHRARRGAVGAAILAQLAEHPMHGYELINALDERSGGRWKPSPGSIYPALRRLEYRGFIRSTETESDDKRRFELTDAGRERLAEHERSGGPNPWDDPGMGAHGELRRAMSELSGPARQIGRFGSPEQIAAAVSAVTSTTAALYRILADGVADDTSATPPTDPAG
jgi:DNA-binding PadR family transcriptional regulator